MISKVKYIVVSFLMILAFSGANAKEAGSAAASSYRYCMNQDFGGVYLVNFASETPPSHFAKFFATFPYHYYAFYANNVYSFFYSKTPVTSQLGMNETLASTQQSKTVYRFVVGKKGDLVLFEDKEVKERYQCLFVLQNTGQYQAGDMVLSAPATTKNNELIKLLRRWTPLTAN